MQTQRKKSRSEFDIITCGSATLDVFVRTKNELVRVRHHKKQEKLLAYPAGGKILIDKLEFELGGGGTNTAVAFARQGYQTGFVGALGADETAQQILKRLQLEKVTFLGNKKTTKITQHSGYSIILDSKEHDRTILAFKGSNDDVDTQSAQTIPRAKAYYFSSMLHKSLNAQISLAKVAKKNGALIAYNPSSYLVSQGLKKIKPLLQRTDILIFNKEEAQLLTKKKTLVQMHRLLQSMSIAIVIITDGPNAVTCSHKRLLATLKPKKVKVVESTGAGDAFAAGFVGTYIYTNNIAKSLCAAQANAQSVISYVGAKRGLLTKKQLLAAKSIPIKITRL